MKVLKQSSRKYKPTEVKDLAALLLQSLDESLFFSTLDNFIKSSMKVDKSYIFLALDDKTTKLISKNGCPVVEQGELKNKTSAKHVIQTRSPYFSNNVKKDPFFIEEKSQGIKAELCVPIVQEGIVIATIHLQTVGKRQFETGDVTKILAILAGLEKPLKNMKMYLTAKGLNESLMRKIEQKNHQFMQASTIVSSLQHDRPFSENISLSGNFYQIEEKTIIAKSRAMLKVLEMADTVAANNTECLIWGERGTGREMVAKRIHSRSPRKDFSFTSIDCSAFSEKRLELELFGRESDSSKGILRHQGLIESCNNGTLFLNNIEHLGLSLQAKINSFLNGQAVFKIAGTTPIVADTCIIASTSIDLIERIRQKLFLEDLYYTLEKNTLSLPRLQDRCDDIGTLSLYFLNLHQFQENYKTISPEAIEALKTYSWPGHIRELRSTMERVRTLCPGRVVEKNHLPPLILDCAWQSEQEEGGGFHFLPISLDKLEKKHICAALKHLHGNKTQTANLLGITVKTLYNKLHSYGLISPAKNS